MKNVFVPYYINNDSVKNMYQIALNRYTNIDFNGRRTETTIQATMPLAELTCGKILQGTATITLFKAIQQAEIDISSRSLIDIYVNLENLLTQQNVVKSLTSASDLTNLATGDIVELECIIKKGDSTLDFLNESKLLLEYQQIKNNIDNSQIINWIDKNINAIIDTKSIKFSTEPLFNSNTHADISLCSKDSLMDLDCYIGRHVTVVGEIINYDSSHSANELISYEPNRMMSSYNAEEAYNYKKVVTNLLLDMLKSNNLYSATSFKSVDSLNPEEASDSKSTNHIEIVPFIIYL